jgi:hypothetical protein
MKIRWVGKYNGSNLPVAELPPGAKELPPVTGKSALAIIPVVLVVFLLVYLKGIWDERILFSRLDLAIGFGIGILLFPVHELIHALCFPAGSEVVMYYTAQGLGTSCTAPLKRNRFIYVSVFPTVILGLIPLVLFMAIPSSYVLVETILFAVSFLHLGAGYVDYCNLLHLMQIPRNAFVQISGEKIYWYLKESENSR